MVYIGSAGDLNCDMNLDIGDIRYIASYLCTNPQYSLQCIDADFNADGVVNSGDLRYLAFYIAEDPLYIPLYP